ncbi:hypothetical protein F5Y03DRAFT_400067 [Xylaria venustula]|nr:hypothetical protein F5Y03DRAFT_400067 [Xylaria venustula]
MYFVLGHDTVRQIYDYTQSKLDDGHDNSSADESDSDITNVEKSSDIDKLDNELISVDNNNECFNNDVEYCDWRVSLVRGQYGSSSGSGWQWIKNGFV